VPIDRDATLKQAEKLLRQGRLDGAIAEYVRLVQEQPNDWNSRNALGDLYVRAGQTDKAIEQFRAIADALNTEGFFPRAAALYKKVLKLREDEHSQLRLVDIAMRQGLLADAKMYLRQVGEQRRFRGDTNGQLEIVIRLGTIDPDDADAKRAAARAARQIGDEITASVLLKEAAEVYEKQKRTDDARQALLEALELDPSASDDPRLLLIVARREFEADRLEQGRSALTRLLSSNPEHRDDVVTFGCELAQQGKVETAFLCVDLVADLALLNGDVPGAAIALQAFTDQVPDHALALMKLVEVCVDGNLDDLLTTTQGRLADAYLASGRTTEARVIAEDLVARHPSAPENIARFRRALVQLGEADPDAVIAARLGGEHPFETHDGEIDLSMPSVGDTTPQELAADPSASAPVAADTSASERDSNIVLMEISEIDLSSALADLTGSMTIPEPMPAPAPMPAPDLDAVFADIRARVASEDEASEQYRAGVAHLTAGRTDDGIAALESAVRVPVMRFLAAAELGRVHIREGNLSRGVEWLERAAEAPAPTPDEGHALLFELADALERLGESARALAILMELSADAPGYRDVHARVDRLARVQAGE
jgi:tetratricopeptide (TPR) repeat protein